MHRAYLLGILETYRARHPEDHAEACTRHEQQPHQVGDVAGHRLAREKDRA